MQQRVIQAHHGCASGHAAESAVNMGRLHSRFQLVAPRALKAAGVQQQFLRLQQQRLVPQRGVLLCQWHVVAGRAAPRKPARVGVEHQGQKTQRLGFLRHQAGQQTGQPKAFFGQAAAARFGARGVEPAFSKSGVGSGQNGVQPLRHVMAVGHHQGHARLFDLGLGAHQTLAHGGG